jgi:hypothetical protein
VVGALAQLARRRYIAIYRAPNDLLMGSAAGHAPARLGPRVRGMDSGTTVLVSVATSSVVAAIFSGLFAARNERKKQLLESRRILAGDFAGEAMRALVKLRHYKPTTGPNHRNARLHEDLGLRAERAEAVSDAIDVLRPLRGRVWVTFPGRSSEDEPPQTTCDWAEEVIAALRDVQKECGRFWKACDRQSPDSRPSLEKAFDAAYDVAKEKAWKDLDKFADSAAKRLG